VRVDSAAPAFEYSKTGDILNQTSQDLMNLRVENDSIAKIMNVLCRDLMMDLYTILVSHCTSISIVPGDLPCTTAALRIARQDPAINARSGPTAPRQL